MKLRINKLFRENMLLFVIFLTGGAVLVLEVTAVRVLTIYFGNTIYTVSSVISVILLALSLGYYRGGRLADSRASEGLFYKIILASGAAVLAIYYLTIVLVPVVSPLLSIRSGPLIISLLLFFAPSFLLGMLSPTAAVLQCKRRKTGVGRVTGDVYFWSTMGSIIGSLGTGFFLIPSYGIDSIILGVGILLVVISSLGLLAGKDRTRGRVLLLIVIAVVMAAGGLLFNLPEKVRMKNIIYSKDGVYERISVYDGIYKSKPVRFLRQDIDRTSAVFPDSEEMVFEYTKYYLIYKLTHQDIKNSLVIGSGAYSIPKALLKENPSVQVDVVDIEPLLINVAKKYFRLAENSRLKNYINDGRRFLDKTSARYDLIFSDAFSFSVPFQLTTQEFFELTRKRLNPNGIFVLNIVGSLDQDVPSFAWSEIATFKKVFPQSVYFAAESPKSEFMQNIILVGYNTDQEINLDFEGFQDEKFLATVSTKLININNIDFRRHQIFTDNYAPSEYYMSLMLKGF